MLRTILYDIQVLYCDPRTFDARPAKFVFCMDFLVCPYNMEYHTFV